MSQHDAFLSYSRSDEALAAAFETGLEKLAKPLLKLRALDVFRDRSDLAGPLLGSAIEAALAGSRWLIVFASPASAGSPWCVHEQQWWLDRHGTERLLVVLTGGEIAWDRTANDFDWARTSALAPVFGRRFAEEPLWIDLRWAHELQRLDWRHPRFRDAVVAAAAPIRGQRKDQIDSADLRQLARNRAFVRSGVAAVAVAGIVAAWQAVVASRERDAAVAARAEAERQRDAALGRTLALGSAAVREREPASLEVAALLALEALRIDPGAPAQQALRAAAALLPSYRWRVTGDVRSPAARVRALAFSPDGTRLASAHEDGLARVVEIATGRELAAFSHGEAVTALAFSADGAQLATASRDGSARLWRSDGGEAIHIFRHDGPVATVARHPAEPLLASGSEDHRLRLWNLADASERASFDLGAEVRQVAFGPDPRWLAAIATNGCVVVIEVTEARESMRRCAGQAGLALAWSPDGSRIAVARGDHAAVIDARTGTPSMRASHGDAAVADSDSHLRWITDVAWSPDGQRLATTAREGSVRLWHVERGSEARRLVPGDAAVAFSPGGDFVASGSHDGTARLWDARTGREILRAGHPGSVEVVSFSRDGLVVASGASDGSVSVWHTTRADEMVSIRHDGELNAIAASGDGARLASATRSGRVQLWSADGALRAGRAGLPGVGQLLFSADGQRLIAALRGSVVMLLDTASLEPQATLKLPGGGDWLLSAEHLTAWDRASAKLRTWSADTGAELAAVDAARAWRIGADPTHRWLWAWHADARGREGRIVVRRLPSLEKVAEWPFDREPVATLSPDARTFIVTAWERGDAGRGAKHFLEWRDVATGERRQRVEVPARLDGLRLDPKGAVLIGWAEGDAVRSWDAASGTPRSVWNHEDVRALRFAPGGDALAIGTGRAVHVVDPHGGGELARLDLADGFSALAWPGDASRLHIATHDGLLSGRLWRGEELRALVCRRIGRDLSANEWSRHVGASPWRATCTQASAAR